MSTSQGHKWLETPLIYSSRISELLRASVYLKLENLQPSHSFKYRGISLFIERAIQEHGNKVQFFAASGGNAGLAAACAANAFGVKCTVYLPLGASQSTIDILKRQKADVQVIGQHYADAVKAAQTAVDSKRNAVMVPAYEHEIIWEGHGSMVKEISAQLGRKPDAIFCSVGGGGMLGGIFTGCEEVGWGDVPVVTLGCIGTDSFYHTMSLNRNKDHPLPPNTTLKVTDSGLKIAHFDKFTSKAWGSLGASEPAEGVVKMALERPGLVTCVTIPDELAMQAHGLFADDHKMLVELACATTLAPAYKPSLFDNITSTEDPDGKKVVVFIVCGGFKTSLAEAMEYRRLVEENVAKGGAWEVFIDGSDVISVDKVERG